MRIMIEAGADSPAAKMPGRYSARTAVVWLAIYVLVAASPLALAVWNPPPARTWLVDFGTALGLLGLGMLAAQSLFSGRLRWVAPAFGADNVLHFHKRMGVLAVLFVLAHPVTIILGDPGYLRFLDPRDDAPRAISLGLLIAALLLILITSLWRLTMGLSYEIWRLIHGILAFGILLLALGHALMVDHFLEPLWKKALLCALVGAAVYLVMHSRLVGPWLNRKRPWRVVSVVPERGDAHTVTLTPHGHTGLHFQPGQYAWFTLGNSPFSLQQHPFSLACGADARQVCFTAAAVGDFTRGLKHVQPGTTAWLEGPLGSFIPDPDPATPLFLVAGGIGITPFIGILRTLAGAHDRRHITLMYANQSLDKATLHEELSRLQPMLNLTVVYVPEEPPADWDGESGLIDDAMVVRHLPPAPARVQCLICGPEPLMNIVEAALRGHGISWRRIYTERFQIV